MRHSLRHADKSKNGVSAMWHTALIYAVVLGVIGGVIFLGVSLFRSDKFHEEVTTAQGAQLPAQKRVQLEVDAKLPVEEVKMKIPASSDLTGKWFTKFKEHSIIEVTFGKDNYYELIYTSDPQGRLRDYSRGKYNFNEQSGKIKLYPDLSMGEPQAIEGVKYENITARNYELILRKEQGEDSFLYFMALSSQRVSRRFHPMFSYSDFTGAPVLKFARLVTQ